MSGSPAATVASTLPHPRPIPAPPVLFSSPRFALGDHEQLVEQVLVVAFDFGDAGWG